MIKIEKVKVVGLEEAIRGMRNPKNSWDRSDSYYTHVTDVDIPVTVDSEFHLGENDRDLMQTLAEGGPVHAKYRRMIVVYLDITAPLYWWKEFDTYKVGTVANSCSTMHKIHDKEFTLDDFSTEHLYDRSIAAMEDIIGHLNYWRDQFNEFEKKGDWWQMIQLLPSSYNQKRTIMLNYEVLASMYKWRKAHKLDEWKTFCKWIKSLPYSDLITGEFRKEAF